MFFFIVVALYFYSYLFLWIVLAFAFFLYCTPHTTQNPRPRLDFFCAFFSFVLSSVSIVYPLSLCHLLLYHTQHKHPSPTVLFCIPLHSVLHCAWFFVFMAQHFAFLSLLTTQISMPPAGLEPAIPASERPQTLALDRSATGMITC